MIVISFVLRFCNTVCTYSHANKACCCCCCYKERCSESQRMPQQVKKWQQNLEYEFKQFKQRSRSTGEAGIQKIKEGFPYFNIVSFTFTSEPSINEASQIESVNVSLDESEPPEKRKAKKYDSRLAEFFY